MRGGPALTDTPVDVAPLYTLKDLPRLAQLLRRRVQDLVEDVVCEFGEGHWVVYSLRHAPNLPEIYMVTLFSLLSFRDHVKLECWFPRSIIPICIMAYGVPLKNIIVSLRGHVLK